MAEHDVQFEVQLVEDAGTRVLVPAKRQAAGEADVGGRHTAAADGLLCLVWDNTCAGWHDASREHTLNLLCFHVHDCLSRCSILVEVRPCANHRHSVLRSKTIE